MKEEKLVQKMVFSKRNLYVIHTFTISALCTAAAAVIVFCLFCAQKPLIMG